METFQITVCQTLIVIYVHNVHKVPYHAYRKQHFVAQLDKPQPNLLYDLHTRKVNVSLVIQFKGR